MSRIMLISGSQRRESYNARLLRYLTRGLDGRCGYDFLEPAEVNLPLFDQDLETDTAVIQRVATLHARMQSCDGYVVASPEYNGQPTPYLKNLVDWVSRLAYIDNSYANPFLDRPLLLCSASTGWSGGTVGLPRARELFTYVGCRVLEETICVPHANQAWGNDGFMFDLFFDAEIDQAVALVLHQADVFGQARCGVSEAA